MLVGVRGEGCATEPYIYGDVLERVISFKYLGVLLSEDGRWEAHWIAVRGKARKSSSLIRRFCGLLNLAVSWVVLLVKLILVPTFFYGVPL